ncbi:hypothetical protein P170DRAFT_426080 [Aspergillus steynii IBT 23096]|uniref:MYND-type zinc finger protein samB n=1 Tax=Aspergillus steynii IBT 23096 TaxID=1392250 RepID=A0A2I2G897_9EURO|nr:uncharacterized protein P170DRAFT_426080 [Aspergillus steynii IBT 23096]PLB49107.1 hypothetical protein P170DRAFT_426080 [Aspergillus steynii IBT 23096]
MSDNNRYRSRCILCGSTDTPLPEECSMCRAASFCSAECKGRAVFTKKHIGCEAVGIARYRYEEKLGKYRDHPVYRYLTDPDNMEYHRLPEGPQYPAAQAFRGVRWRLAASLRFIRTRQATKEMLQLIRAEILLGDFAYRDRILEILGPSLLMGDDNTCYQIITRMCKHEVKGVDLFSTIQSLNLNLMEGSNGMEALTDMDILSDMELFSCYDNLRDVRHKRTFKIAIALIKFRLLQRLNCLPVMTETMGPKVPQEILDVIYDCVVKTDFSSDLLQRIKSREDHENAVATLTNDIDTLFQWVGLKNWSLFLDSGNSEKWVDKKLHKAFFETPGAEKHFRELLDRHRAGGEWWQV